MNPVDDYFYSQQEPYQSIMLYVRSVILKTLPDITEIYRYRIPFYKIDNKPLMYLNVLKGTDYVDVAFVQGILLEADFPILKNDNKRKQVRSIQLKAIEDLNEAEFVALLHEAKRHIDNSEKAWFV